jgi:DNA polymerase/3'-5' exonuclease PolX
VKLPGIGGKRARSMWDIGIRSIADVSNSANKKKIYTILGVKIAKAAIEAAKEAA